MATETVIHDTSGDIDLTMYTEEERTAILSVIEKAKVAFFVSHCCVNVKLDSFANY